MIPPTDPNGHKQEYWRQGSSTGKRNVPVYHGETELFTAPSWRALSIVAEHNASCERLARRIAELEERLALCDVGANNEKHHQENANE